MSKLSNVALRVAFCATMGLGMLAAGMFASNAQAPQGTAAENGIVGIAIGLTAPTIGAPARLVVERVVPGGPAEAAGIRRGDEIVAIDGHRVTGKSLREIVSMIRGQVGTPVTLALSEKSRTHEVTLTRGAPAQ
jgi:carboxyl-terminal processing protease